MRNLFHILLGRLELRNELVLLVIGSLVETQSDYVRPLLAKDGCMLQRRVSKPQGHSGVPRRLH